MQPVDGGVRNGGRARHCRRNRCIGETAGNDAGKISDSARASPPEVGVPCAGRAAHGSGGSFQRCSRADSYPGCRARSGFGTSVFRRTRDSGWPGTGERWHARCDFASSRHLSQLPGCSAVAGSLGMDRECLSHVCPRVRQLIDDTGTPRNLLACLSLQHRGGIRAAVLCT